MSIWLRWLFVSFVLAAGIGSAFANETTTYTFDALGRLIAVSSSGTVNNGQNVSTSFDPAGNRTNYAVSGTSISTPTISIAGATVTEGGTLNFVVTRTGSIAGAATVNFATANGTAVAPGDYTASSNVLTIPVGQASATIPIVTIDDTLVESAETMTVTLSSPSTGYVLGTASATGTINDNDAGLAIGNASVTEGGTLAFTVTRSGYAASALTVNYASASGTATSGADFTATSGTLNLAANQTTGTINVPTIDDTLVEGNETLTMTLSGASAGATITNAVGTGTIIDNDTAWSGALTAGWVSSQCYTPPCTTPQGYILGTTGSLSPNTFNGYTIDRVYSISSAVMFGMKGTTTPPPNSGWTQITIPNVGTFTRASATYSTNGAYAVWQWSPGPNLVKSGTVIVQ